MTQLIYPQHRLFEPYRMLAETSPLEVIRTMGGGKQIQFMPVFIPPEIKHYFFGEQNDTVTDPSERAKRFWYEEGGLNTLSHQKAWPGRLGNMGLRLGLPVYSISPYCTLNAYETIGFGTGTLRPAKQSFGSFRASVEEMDDKPAHAVQIDSSKAKKQGCLVQDVVSSAEGWRPVSVIYYSSNIVMPEVVGELQQLHNRRREKDLLDTYLKQLVTCCTKIPIEVQNAPGLYQPGINTTPLVAPPSLQSMQASYAIAHVWHLDNGFYNELPKTRVELMERVEDLLSRIVFDDSPIVR